MKLTKLTVEELSQLIGKKLGRLTVSALAEEQKGIYRYLCDCACGETKVVARGTLIGGKTKSCGCLQKEAARASATHGATADGKTTPEYDAWKRAKARCFNPREPAYAGYGGRGITMCDEWKDSFENFLADMGRRPSPKHSLDRKDNDKNYSPDNCRWADKRTQSNNTRRNVLIDYEGKDYSMAELARHLELDYSCFSRLYRIRGLPLHEAISHARKLQSLKNV